MLPIVEQNTVSKVQLRAKPDNYNGEHLAFSFDTPHSS